MVGRDAGPVSTAQRPASGRPRRRVDGRLVVLLVVVALYSRGTLTGSLNPVALRTWTTVFVAIVTQALPFLVLGVLVSGAITALVSPAVLARLLPRSAALAVPSAALAGTALPGCECASVPIAGRLCARGVQPAAALAFMLAAPAVNPVVLVATAVAFPGQPRMVLARFLGSLLTSVAVGLLWWRVGGDAWVERARLRVAGADGPGWPAFSSAARHDLWDAGGWLVVGAAAAATLQVLMPRSLLGAVADHPALAVLALGGLAVRDHRLQAAPAQRLIVLYPGRRASDHLRESQQRTSSLARVDPALGCAARDGAAVIGHHNPDCSSGSRLDPASSNRP